HAERAGEGRLTHERAQIDRTERRMRDGEARHRVEGSAFAGEGERASLESAPEVQPSRSPGKADRAVHVVEVPGAIAEPLQVDAAGDDGGLRRGAPSIE